MISTLNVVLAEYVDTWCIIYLLKTFSYYNFDNFIVLQYF